MFTKKISIVVVLVLGTGVGCQSADGVAESDAGADPTDLLFDADRLIDVRIELAPADWDTLRHQGRGLATTFSGCHEEFEYTYFDATVWVDGERFEHAGVRKKGFLGSISVIRPSLKVNFGKFVEGGTLFGMKRLTLNNDRQDPSHTHQVMSYSLFREAGLVAPRCNLAQVTVNGEFLGVYSHVESIKKPFLARSFASDEGNLYEGQLADFTPELVSRFERKTNKTVLSPDGSGPDTSDLVRVIQALAAEDAQWLEALEQEIDLESFITFWAIEAIVGHWDGYSGDRNNFYIYRDPEIDRFVFIPWGTDGAFDPEHQFLDNSPLSVYAWSTIAHRLYHHPATRMRYLEEVRLLLDEVWDEAALLEEVDRIANLASGDEKTLEKQREFILARKQAILKELTGDGAPWPYPFESQSIECIEPAEVSGTFRATWGSPQDVTTNGDVSLNLVLAGEQQTFTTLYNSAGLVDDPLDAAAIIYYGVRESGSSLLVVLCLVPADVKPGTVNFHGLETFGAVFEVSGTPNDLKPLSYIGDGAILLETASPTPGNEISGTFSGLISEKR